MEISLNFSMKELLKREFLVKNKFLILYPSRPFCIRRSWLYLTIYKTYKSWISVTWLGHATFLIRISNKTIILNGSFSFKSCRTITYIGPKRFVQPGISINNLPKIDIILISHNHYDHLDTKTLKKN